MKKYDFIIVGTGAGGATIAYELAKSGKQVLILERGDFLPQETDNWNPKAVFTDGKYRPEEKWLDKEDNEFEPFTHYCVGGNTKMYGAALLRMRESDFSEVKHYGGVSPSWPLDYSEFEPYYTKAEKLYHVHGQRGVDPTDPVASEDYPYPPLKLEPKMKELFGAIKDLGLNPAPLPIGVRLPKDDKVKRGKVNLSLFDGYPDPTESKADAHVIALNKALKHKNVVLKTNRTAIELRTNAKGDKVTEVVCLSAKDNIKIYTGDTVIVSCGAINTAALLLKSTNDIYPNGLANSSGMVGRNLMIHNNGTVVAISKTLNDSKFQKAFIISDFYHGAKDSELPLGSIQLMGKTDPDTLRSELEAINPDKSWDVEDVASHSIDFFITAEDLPDHNNRVMIAEDDQIKIDYTPNNLEAYTRLRKKLIGILSSIDCEEGYCKDTVYAGFKLGVSGVSHQNGTCRFGTDPTTSVLDINCRAHDVDNLYVVDSSFFCSSSAVNPSLTIIANALRVADHLLSKNLSKN